MSVSRQARHEAFVRIANVPGLHMSFKHMAEDIVVMSESWPNNEDFNTAVTSTVRAIELARDGRVSANYLRDDLATWRSYHYQFSRSQGEPAELRLVYRCEGDGSIKVMGFGHRYLPDDFYHRITRERKGA